MKFEETKKSELSKHFISMKDGQNTVGIFRGEVFAYKNYWDNEKKRSVLVDEVTDEYKETHKPKSRYRLNLVVNTAEKNAPAKLEAKVFEFGWKMYGLLSELNKDYPLETNYIKISRVGEGLNTQWSAIPLPIKPGAETMAAIEMVKLLPLDPKDAFWTEANTDLNEEGGVPF